MANTRIEIHNLPIDSHRDYATNADYDRTHAIEASHVHKHAELAGTSSIYASELNDLTGVDQTPSTWAAFPLPLDYDVQTNRFFSTRLFPTAKSSDEEVAIFLKMAEGLSESEKKTIEKFARTYDLLSHHLAEAHARRLNLQKG